MVRERGRRKSDTIGSRSTLSIVVAGSFGGWSGVGWWLCTVKEGKVGRLVSVSRMRASALHLATLHGHRKRWMQLAVILQPVQTPFRCVRCKWSASRDFHLVTRSDWYVVPRSKHERRTLVHCYIVDLYALIKSWPTSNVLKVRKGTKTDKTTRDKKSRKVRTEKPRKHRFIKDIRSRSHAEYTRAADGQLLLVTAATRRRVNRRRRSSAGDLWMDRRGGVCRLFRLKRDRRGTMNFSRIALGDRGHRMGNAMLTEKLTDQCFMCT